MSAELTHTINDFADIGIFEQALAKMNLSMSEHNGQRMKNYYEKLTEFVPDFLINESHDLLGVKVNENGSLKIQGDSHYLHNRWDLDKLKQNYSECAIEGIMTQHGLSQSEYEIEADGTINMTFVG